MRGTTFGTILEQVKRMFHNSFADTAFWFFDYKVPKSKTTNFVSVSFLPAFSFSLKEDVPLNYFTWKFSKLSPTKDALFELVTNIVLCILLYPYCLFHTSLLANCILYSQRAEMVGLGSGRFK